MRTKNLIITGMFTAILAVLSIIQIPIPNGIPLTMQTFAVALCGFVLGSKQSALCVFLYILIGAIGVPVYSGMTSGLGKLFGVTGGFLIGFIPMAVFCGIRNLSFGKFSSLFFAIIGLLLCHILGGFQFHFLSGNSFFSSMMIVSFPYLVKDILSVVGAYFVSVTLKAKINHSNLFN